MAVPWRGGEMLGCLLTVVKQCSCSDLRRERELVVSLTVAPGRSLRLHIGGQPVKVNPLCWQCRGGQPPLPHLRYRQGSPLHLWPSFAFLCLHHHESSTPLFVDRVNAYIALILTSCVAVKFPKRNVLHHPRQRGPRCRRRRGARGATAASSAADPDWRSGSPVAASRRGPPSRRWWLKSCPLLDMVFLNSSKVLRRPSR